MLVFGLLKMAMFHCYVSFPIKKLRFSIAMLVFLLKNGDFPLPAMLVNSGDLFMCWDFFQIPRVDASVVPVCHRDDMT